jgi:AraC-like DNA-binding protein
VASLGALAAGSRVAVFGFGAPIVAAAERDHASVGFDRGKLERWLRRCTLLPRTVWVHELVHRYVFERYALGRRRNLAIRFLEVELVKELYFLFRDRDEGGERATIVRTHSAPVDRAVRHIEAHLFDPPSVAALARRAGASASTLLRAFRNEVGCSPGAYWRNRKLDEALVVLRAGGSVGEAAARVGYDNPTAFGFAFRRRFGQPPSTFRPRRPVRAAP